MSEEKAQKKPVLLKVLLPILLIIGAVSVTFLALQPERPSVSSIDLEIGAQVPDLEIYPLQGEKTYLSNLGARVLLINFWATWCAPCLIELPSLQALHQTYQDRGFKVITMSVDDEPQQVVPPLIQKMNLSLPVFVDREQRLGALFEVQGLPHTVILDENRSILHIETGERDWNSSEVREQLEIWLKK